MSLSEPALINKLNSKFVAGFRDISDEPYCGLSGKHDATNPAAKTTNGAGPHNTQLFVLDPDGTVLHCLPGFWDPRDLALELDFAAQLGRVWRDPKLNAAQKRARFTTLQLEHLGAHPQDMVDRSVMQGFDKKHETRFRADTSDCVLREGGVQPKLRPRRPKQQDEFKTCDQIVHERMAARPFVAYAAFDTAAYADYGRPKYDKRGQDGCTEQIGHAKPKKAEKPKRRRGAAVLY